MPSLVPIDPPGTLCNYAALKDLLRRIGGRTFVDVGCGAGRFSRFLLSQGFTGYGVDFSPAALAVAARNLREPIADGRYALLAADVLGGNLELPEVDVALAYMVMEHVEDDVGFVGTLAGMVRDGGYVVTAAPGRRDHWCLEDQTVGHLRRYDRADMAAVLEQAGLESCRVWSVAVPVSNLLFRLGNRLLERSDEVGKAKLGQREQTQLSGLQEIPWKTVYPPWVRWLLNPVVMAPFFALQRAFYETDLGVTVLGHGRVRRSS